MQQRYASEFGPVLSLPLTKLIGYAICNEVGFRQLIGRTERAISNYERIEADFPKMNELYIRDKLEDLIKGQFSQRERFLVELVANALDSRTDRILIRHTGNMVQVDDFGIGMDLEDLMKDLSIPFYTNKDGKSTIGRFGIGFFSALIYLYDGGFVSVDTKHDDSGYQVIYKMKDGDINVSFSESGRMEKGTSVKLFFNYAKNRLDVDETRGYLIDNVGYILPERCRILFNGKDINSIVREKSSTQKSYEIPFGQEKILASLDYSKKKPGTITYMQTIKVKEYYFPFEVFIDFPLSLDLVESRNEFIDSERFCEAEYLVFRDAFLKYFGETSHSFDRKTRKRILAPLENGEEYRAFVIEFLQRASKNELLELFKILSPMIKNKDMIIARHNYSYLFLSEDANCLNSLFPFFVSKYDQYIKKNPNILTEKSFIESRTTYKKKISDLTQKEIAKYFLYSVPHAYTEALFMDLNEDSILPYMMSMNSELWINTNHRIFKIPKDKMNFEQRSALDWFSQHCRW